MVLTRFANVPIDMFVFNCFLPGFAVLALSVLELEQPIMKPSLFSFIDLRQIVFGRLERSRVILRFNLAYQLEICVLGFIRASTAYQTFCTLRYGSVTFLAIGPGEANRNVGAAIRPPPPKKETRFVYLYIFLQSNLLCTSRSSNSRY